MPKGLSGHMNGAGRDQSVNWEAHVLSRKNQARRMGPVLPHVLIFQEKQEMDFYIKHSRFFYICNLDFFQNVSVGFLWPSGYQSATLLGHSEQLLLP